jgi:dTDP-4-amino-4,6-dideoxygalactose transaminase
LPLCGLVNGKVYFRVMHKVPFYSLEYQHRSIQNELRKTFLKIIEKGRFILDKEVQEFEREYASFQNAKFCISVGNGHDAILIALKALNVKKGDEVLVPSHTCHATWLAVVNAGARPVPVEVDPSTYNIDPLLIENRITTKTKGIVPVHLYGHPCKMDEIMTIAQRNKLLVIEDNAQAHGAIYKAKLTGSWGHCNATSFYPTKNLGALGDGGAIISNDRELVEFAKAFRNYGSVTKDDHSIMGVNSRLDELQAAILRIKLKKLDEWNEVRRQNASYYFDLLKNVGDIQLPPPESRRVIPVFHLFVVKTNHRNKLKEYLGRTGIETAIHYPLPVHLQKAYSYLGYGKGSLPVAERLSQTVLSLPIWPGLKEQEVEQVCDEIRKYYNRVK